MSRAATTDLPGLRNPCPDELAELSALCLRSKAVWGYDAVFIEACHHELTLTVRDLQQTCLQVAEDADGIIGVAQVSLHERDAILDKLFVEPARLRCGAGRLLFQWAVAAASGAGASRVIIDADPDAAGFYQRLGARQTGMVQSGSIPGLWLPRLILDL